jgi:hypothetical protein
MRSTSLSFLLLATPLAALLAGCHAAEAPRSADSVLPLRTVHLYETGVGYFERAGTIVGGEQATLPVPAGHLDDALKTLVVLGDGGERTVAGVEFGSSVSRAMGRALAGLPLDADAPVTHFDMLASLKGAHVEVSLSEPRSAPLRGRIIDVLPPEPSPPPPPSKDGSTPSEPQPPPGPTLLFAGDGGAIQKLLADDIASVRPTDPAFAARLDAALDALNAHATRTPRNLRILMDGGPVTVGYVAETPMWRTTYRVVLGKDDAKAATLQGWALVHNDTDEAWKNVRVTLVNGQPDSFLFPLAAPRYARRELVTPENEASTVPQLLGQTVDAIWGDHIGDSYGAGGFGLSGIGQGGGGRGEGIGLGSIGTIGYGSGTGTGASSLLEVGNLAGIANATGVEAGVLFSYTLGQGLDLRPHGSALVPFVGAQVDAERITWLGSPQDDARSAVRFVNSTSQTLPSGPVSIFADGGFAGEAAIDRLKPSERRFLRFGADLDVELTVDASQQKETIKRVTFENGSIVEHTLRTTDAEWTVENRSGLGRRVYVSLPIVSNATVTGADGLDFDTEAARPIVIVKLDPRSKAKKSITSVEGISHRVGLGALRSDRLAKLLDTPDLSANEKAVLGDLLKAQKAIEELQQKHDTTKAEIAQLTRDTDRLNEHLKAAGGDKAQGTGPGSAGPIVTRILAAEDQLQALRKTLKTQETERLTRIEGLSRLAQGLAAR